MSSSLDDLLSAASSFSLVSAPVTGTSVAFASPVEGGSPLSVEGVEGGYNSPIEGTGYPKRSYPVVLVIGHDRSLCFGAVGAGSASFCIRRNCKIKAHAENKIGGFDTRDSCYFISRVAEATVFSEPYVREFQVPMGTRDEWKDKMWPLSQWVRAFRAVAIAEDDDADATTEDIFIATKMLADAERFKTPSKKRKIKTEGDETDDDRLDTLEQFSFVPHVRTLPVEGGKELDALIIGGSMAKGGLTKIVARVESSVIVLGNALGEMAKITHGRFDQAEENVQLVSGAVQNLLSALGRPVMMDVKFEAPTLWGTTSFIGEEVGRVSYALTDTQAKVDFLNEFVKRNLNDLKEAEEGRSEANSKMLKVLGLVMGRVQAIAPEIQEVRNDVSKLAIDFQESGNRSKRLKQQVPSRSSKGGSNDNAMDDLMTLLTSNATMGDARRRDGLENDSTGGDERGTEEKLGAEMIQVVGNLRRLEDRVQMIIGDVGLLKACAEDKSIKFGGLGLRTLQDCHSWIEENFQGLRYGLVMDPLLMLDRIFGSDDVEAESQFKILESRVKLKITTGAEAAAIKALHFNRPRLFHKGRVAMTSERNASKLSKLPTFKSWKSGGEGVRNYVTKQMNLIHSTVSHDIGYAFGSDPRLAQAHSVATASLNSTITFLTQLMGFIDTIYEKLHLHSKFSSDQAWSLTTQILDRVCEDLYAPKEGVAAAMTVEDPSSICSHLLWSCFRTHDVMAGYIEHNFENHPAISAEYVKFLATNSGYDKVEKMEINVLGMKDNVTKATDLATKANKNAETATDRFSASNKEIESLKKRIQTLENKAGK